MSFDIDGFTTLVGRNFIGKSATLMAVNAALTNQQGTDFIRWGEKFCEVRIVTKDLDILWHKEKSNNFYVINNETYKKVGAQPPPDPILQAGFGVTDVAGEKLNLLYAEQFFPLFLVDRKDSKSADLLISIYGLDRLYKAVDLCEKDKKKSRELLKLRRGDRDIAKQELERFCGFDDIQKKMSELNDIKLKIQQQENEIATLRDKTRAIIECTIEIKKLRPIRGIEIPDTAKTKAIIEEFQDLSKKLEKLRELKTDISNLRKAQSSQISENIIQDIQDKIKNRKELRVYKLRFDSLSKEIKKLHSASKIDISLPKLDFEELNSLKQLHRQISSCAIEVRQLRSDLENTESEIEQTEKELNTYERCPVCGSKRNSL